jgi:O-antigen/teichoic acid export membrane protein
MDDSRRHPVTAKPLAQAKFLVFEGVVALFSGLVMILLISRVRGGEFLGQYVVVATWLALFQPLANLGIPDLILRETGRHPDESGIFVSCGLLLSGISSSLAAIIMLVVVRLLHYAPEVESALELSCLTLLPVAIVALIKSGFIAHNQLRIYLLISLPEMLVILLFNTHFVVNNYQIGSLVKTILFTRTTSSLALLYVLNRAVIPIDRRFHPRVLRALLAPLFSFSMSSIAVLAFWRIDIIMLSKMTTISTAGIYATASKCLEVVSILPASFSQSIFPHLARQFAVTSVDRRDLERAIRNLFYLVVPISMASFLFAEPIIRTIFGPTFTPAVPALRIFMVTFLILASDMVMAIICQAAGYQRIHVYFSLINITINILLNFALIPIASIVGASLATVISISVSAILHYRFVSKNVIPLNWGAIMMRPLATGIVLAMPVVLLKEKVHFVLLGIAYVVAYGLVFARHASAAKTQRRGGS